MARGCVRVDLTVRLGRGVEGVNGAAYKGFSMGGYVSINVLVGAVYLHAFKFD